MRDIKKGEQETLRSILHDISMSELHRMRDEGLNLKEIAEKAGISTATACKYLKGYKRKPITETTAERIPLKAAESVRIVSDDEAVRIARERFSQRMMRVTEQPMERPTEQKPTVFISHIAYEGRNHYYNVRENTIQIYDRTSNICHMSVEYVDDFIKELQGIKQMITAIKPLLCKEKKDDDTSDD